MCQLKRAHTPQYILLNTLSSSASVRYWLAIQYRILSLVFILIFVQTGHAVVAPGRTHRGIDMCEPISIPMCSGMPYNMTRMPNHFHHSTQENARLAFKPYAEVLEANCSADLLFYLCAMFVPICTPQFQKEAIPPCRSVCERSRIGCEPLMNKYNYSWPEDLSCDKLPEYDRGVCVSPEAIVSNMPDDTKTGTGAVPLVVNQDCPPCNIKSKPRKKKYKSGNFDYAIAGLVKHMTYITENVSVIRVQVKKIFKRGSVHLQEDRDVDLWTGSNCICPVLKPNKEYLIISRENMLLHRLMYNETSLVARWNKKWEAKLTKWTKTKSQKKDKGKNKRRCKKKPCKSNSTRCRIDPATNRKQCRKDKKKANMSVTVDNVANSSRRRNQDRRRRRKNKGRNANATRTTK